MPHLDLSPQRCDKVPPGRGKGERRDRGPEGEVIKHDAPWHAGQNCLAILVDRQKEVALGGQAYPRDILSVGKGEGVGLVAVGQSAHPSNGCQEKRSNTHSTRLKTVTLLPTGEKRWVPSGLKRRLPRQYTVPRRLEN